MLEIKVNELSLELSEGTSVTMTITSPLWTKDVIEGDYSYTFTLPNTPKNRKALGFLDIPGTVASTEELNCQVNFKGLPILTGIVKVVKASPLFFEIYLLTGSGSFANKIKDKNLRTDFNWGGNRTLTNKQFYSYPTDDYCLAPIPNELFFKDTAFEGLENTTQNAFDTQTNLFKVPANQDINQECAVTPFPYVCYIIETIFTALGYTIKRNYFTENETLKKLILYNNFDVADTMDTGEQYDHKLNRIMTVWFMEDCIPNLPLTDFIFALEQTFNVKFVVDNQGYLNIINRDEIIVRNYKKDISNIISSTPNRIANLQLNVTENNGYLFEFENDSADEYLNENVKEVKSSAYIGEFDTINDLPGDQPYGSIAFIIDAQQYVIFEYSNDLQILTWIFYSEFLETYTIDKGSNEYKPNASTLVGFYPSTKIKGAGKSFAEKNDLTIFRFLIAGQTINRMQAVGNVLTEALVTDTGVAVSINYKGDYGLITNLWPLFLYWDAEVKKEYSCSLSPDLLFLTQFDAERKYIINKIPYFVESFQINFGINTFEISDVKLLQTLNYNEEVFVAARNRIIWKGLGNYIETGAGTYLIYK